MPRRGKNTQPEWLRAVFRLGGQIGWVGSAACPGGPLTSTPGSPSSRGTCPARLGCGWVCRSFCHPSRSQCAGSPDTTPWGCCPLCSGCPAGKERRRNQFRTSACGILLPSGLFPIFSSSLKPPLFRAPTQAKLPTHPPSYSLLPWCKTPRLPKAGELDRKGAAKGSHQQRPG